MQPRLIIAVDFDDTIALKAPTYPASMVPGALLPNAKEVINWMYDRGCYIILWTCRCGDVLKLATDFLDKNGIKYHSVNENWPGLPFITSSKICADFYIDDASLGTIINWLEIKKMIKEKLIQKIADEIVALHAETTLLKGAALNQADKPIVMNLIKLCWNFTKNKKDMIDSFIEELTRKLKSSNVLFSGNLADERWLTKELGKFFVANKYPQYNEKFWSDNFSKLI
jgi:hypothetical protein